MKVLNAKYRGYCADCHFTVWQGERVNYDGKVHHVDCKSALLDDTPRVLNPTYARIIGKVSKTRLVARWE